MLSGAIWGGICPVTSASSIGSDAGEREYLTGQRKRSDGIANSCCLTSVVANSGGSFAPCENHIKG